MQALLGCPGSDVRAASSDTRRGALAPRALCAVLLCTSTSWAAVYYVDAQNGGDGNSGLSPDAAWGTLDRIADARLQPGDAVLLRRGGVWREQLTLTRSGAPDAPITVGSYGSGPAALILGSDPVREWRAEPGDIWSAAVPSKVYQVFLDGSRGSPCTSRSDLAESGDWCWSNGRLYLRAAVHPDSAWPSEGVEATVRHGVFAWRARHIIVRDVAVERARYGLYFGQCLDVHCTDVSASWNATDGLMADGAESADILFERCVAHHNLRHGLFAHDASRVVVLAPVSFANRTKYAAGVGFDGVQGGMVVGGDVFGNYYGLKASNGARNVLFSACRAHDNLGFGIDFDTGVSASIIEGCAATGNGSHGIAVERNSAACRILRNRTAANGPEHAGIFVELAGDVEVAYNVIHDEYIGIRFNAEARRCTAYNNTLFGIGGVALSAFNGCRDITLKNNLVAATPLALHVRDDSQSGFASDYNAWPSGSVLKWGSKRLDLKGWQRATRQDRHSLAGDPRLADAATADFRLRAGSPCIDAGVRLGYDSDHEGNPVPQGAAPDLGAYEAPAPGRTAPAGERPPPRSAAQAESMRRRPPGAPRPAPRPASDGAGAALPDAGDAVSQGAVVRTMARATLRLPRASLARTRK